jgi:hypothetical protein
MGVSGQHHAPATLYPKERIPGTHWAGGWVGLRAGLGAEVRRKILCPCWGSNPGHPVRSQTLYWLSYPAPCCFIWTWNLSFILREEYKWRVFKNSVLTVYGPKRKEVTGSWWKLHNEELEICTLHQIFMVMKSRKMRPKGMWHTWKKCT